MKNTILTMAMVSCFLGCTRSKVKACLNGNPHACKAMERKCEQGNKDACAQATYEAASSQYVGNDMYEIRAVGNVATKDETIRGYIYQKSFETCAEKEKGFEILSQEDIGTNETVERRITFWQKINRFKDPTLVHQRIPGARMLIKCAGKVDPELEKKYRASD